MLYSNSGEKKGCISVSCGDTCLIIAVILQWDMPFGQGSVLGFIRWMHVLAVLELNEEKATAGESQQNGDLNRHDQTQMTPFEMNLKEKRFVAAIVIPQWVF